MKKLVIFMAGMVLALKTFSQDKPFAFWDDPKGMILNQSGQLFEQIDRYLRKLTPDTTRLEDRKLPLFALDALYHDERTDGSEAEKIFFEKRYKDILTALMLPANKDQLVVYKLYNHGFIVKTATVTFAFDVVSGPFFDGKRFPLMEESTFHQVLDQVDIFFVSHFHGDHADEQVRDYALKKGKAVVVPPGLWENQGDLVKHWRGQQVQAFSYPLKKKGGSLSVHVLPGHQGDKVLNNVYVVTTPEGYAVAHTGDQANDQDLEWIGKVKEQVKTDILLVNCWNTQIPAVVEGLAPRLVIPGHENELGHSIDHREPHWLSYQHLAQSKVPYIIMTVGEQYRYQRGI